jgi:hypothetical protein
VRTRRFVKPVLLGKRQGDVLAEVTDESSRTRTISKA